LDVLPGKPRRGIDTCSNPRVDFPNPSPEDKAFVTEIVGRSSGELFLYVNDAIFLPLKTTLFYCNNEGSARVTVDAVARRPLREAIKSRFCSQGSTKR